MLTASEIVTQLLEADPTPDPRELISQAGDEIAAAEQSVDINYHNAQTAQYFYHKTKRGSRGAPMQVRRNGKTQTWKTRPGLFRIPVKYGLYEYGQIDNFFHRNADDWQTVPPEPATKQ